MYYLSNDQYQREQLVEWMDYVHKILEIAHQITVITAKTKTLRQAINSNDIMFCFDTAQYYLNKYRNLLNSYSRITNMEVIDITEEDAESRGIFHWKAVLELVEMIIFTDSAKEYMKKSATEKALKSIFNIKIS